MAPATSDDSEESTAADTPDSEADGQEAEDDTAHLDDLPDGSGCTEVWEHLSEGGDEGASDAEDGDDEEA